MTERFTINGKYYFDNKLQEKKENPNGRGNWQCQTKGLIRYKFNFLYFLRFRKTFETVVFLHSLKITLRIKEKTWETRYGSKSSPNRVSVRFTCHKRRIHLDIDFRDETSNSTRSKYTLQIKGKQKRLSPDSHFNVHLAIYVVPFFLERPDKRNYDQNSSDDSIKWYIWSKTITGKEFHKFHFV